MFRRRRAYGHVRLREKRRRYKLIALAAFLILIAVLIVWILRDQRLLVNEVNIEGVLTLDTFKIENVVNSELKGSTFLFIPKRNILFYPKEAVVEQIQNIFPKVKDVKLKIQSFKTLRVIIIEHVSDIAWCGSSSKESDQTTDENEDLNEVCYKISEEGFVYEKINDDDKSLFSLRNETQTEVSVGAHVVSEQTLAPILTLKKYLERRGVLFSSGLFKNNNDCSLRTTGGVDIVFSCHENMLDLANDFFSLTDSSVFSERGLDLNNGFNQIDYIDLRFGKKIFYKLKQ